ncbi:MAG: T9SS type A sorting domain-containing protein [Chlorobi bacterium]|nr:T9SS type A sorting domain-containing protein [Chlorobiota bacterium]MCI0717173.1 T9SS type A sorting domain-containing protein [Chlorobiota bacterium]
MVVTYNMPIGIRPISSNVPVKFNLSQNYPNPFNPAANIKFDIPKSAFIKLVIYDVIGREVSVLVNEQLSAGSYKADWDASNYPSGVYFYKLQAGDYRETKKMVLVK